MKGNEMLPLRKGEPVQGVGTQLNIDSIKDESSKTQT